MTTTETAAAARQSLLDTIATALVAKGFTTEAAGFGSHPRLRVIDATVGLVATLKTDRVRFQQHPALATLGGYVTYSSAKLHSRDGQFALKADGLVNATNILARLRSDVPQIAAAQASRREFDARQASDDAILAALPTVEGARVSVFDGQVSIQLTGRLNDLTPAQAEALLRALAAIR